MGKYTRHQKVLLVVLLNPMDPVADMLTSIVTAQRAGKERIAVPYSRFKQRLALLLQEKKMISKIRVQEGVKPKLIMTLAYEQGRPKIRQVKRLSRPGRRLYAAREDLPWPGGRPGFYVVSTSRGLMDVKTARSQGVGGELVCAVWES